MLFRSLASGSSGNAFLLRTPGAALLFDAGLPLLKLQRALAQEELRLEDITGVLISHEHRDHCQAVSDLTSQYGTPVYANEAVLRALGLLGYASSILLPVNTPCLIHDVQVTTFPVSHDAVCPVGFSISHGDRRIAVATDLGRPEGDVNDVVSESDLVVIEANHDVEMLHQSRYPAHLRRRIASPLGHLSNGQTSGLLSRHARSDTSQVWLAHLSKENNTVQRALTAVRKALRVAGKEDIHVDVALRDRPSLRWSGEPALRQLSFFDLLGDA